MRQQSLHISVHESEPWVAEVWTATLKVGGSPLVSDVGLAVPPDGDMMVVVGGGSRLLVVVEIVRI